MRAPQTDGMEGLLVSATPKAYSHGTQRICSPEETLIRVGPHLRDLGITRVANVTGLDRIGIPVFMVVRPNSRSLAVSQGKGATVAAARASGIMESIETHHAEFARCPITIETFAELRRRAKVADPVELPLTVDSPYAPNHLLPWTVGHDLVAGEPVFVPWELVHANTLVPFAPGSGWFLRTTNGLASGNNRAEAVLHGLLEVIERDAAALWRLHTAEQVTEATIALDTIDDPLAVELLRRYESAGIVPIVWNLTSDTGVAVIRVVIFDPASDPVLKPIPNGSGCGCHPDRGVALVRALTEAAQSRLTAISGSRDDLSPDTYSRARDPAVVELYRRLAEEPGRLDFRTLPSIASETVEADLSRIIDRLRAVGVERVVAVDLSRAELPVHVARVIVPGLEGATDHPHYRPGRRARAAGAAG